MHVILITKIIFRPWQVGSAYLSAGCSQTALKRCPLPSRMRYEEPDSPMSSS